MQDKYCYPETNVLINKLNIKDNLKLNRLFILTRDDQAALNSVKQDQEKVFRAVRSL